YGLVTVYIASTLSIIIIYLSIQAQQNRIMKERELELTQSRISVMLSQIQPHFLYNVLASINELYDGNPKAQQAIVTFADYLRGNMDSLGENCMIPFSKELQHVQQYLWLEEMRFEERLQVAFDIQADGFLLPALTVQPIVENAVRHGLFHKKNGGKVTIATCETPEGHCITVVDDGVGFVPEAGKADGRSHIGIENVRGRLDAMCGGALTIESTPGRGTVATILIPKQKGGPV
ncbi:histidine kinase, partial [Ruminococcaceae bacterium OttesenSCG-928-D13]|nr:histidine kinase [Ruminococcaceae bacterium OttesenSCG-928-D13]